MISTGSCLNKYPITRNSHCFCCNSSLCTSLFLFFMCARLKLVLLHFSWAEMCLPPVQVPFCSCQGRRQVHVGWVCWTHRACGVQHPARHGTSSMHGEAARGLLSAPAWSRGSGHGLSICACLQWVHRHVPSTCLWAEWLFAGDHLASGMLSELWWDQEAGPCSKYPCFSLLPCAEFFDGKEEHVEEHPQR